VCVCLSIRVAAGIRIDIKIKAANQNAADAVGATLTVTAINAKLQQAGLPAVTMLEEATTAPSPDGSSTSDGILPAIIGAATGLVGFLVTLAIAFFCYRWYRTTKTKKRNATATTNDFQSDLTSSELGMRLQTMPGATTIDVFEQVIRHILRVLDFFATELKKSHCLLGFSCLPLVNLYLFLSNLSKSVKTVK